MIIRNWKYIVFILLLIYLSLNYWLASNLVLPRHATVVDYPILSGHDAQELSVETEDSLTINFWHFENYSSKAVILMTGIGGNRMNCLHWVELYLQRGYNVFIPDLRGTGESDGDYISFGWHERKDLKAVYDFVKALRFEEIGVHGQSLGAATACYGVEQGLEYDFMILESCYDNIDNAFANRMWNLGIPPFLFKPAKLMIEYKLDMDSDDLYPENWIKKYNSKLLVLAGDNEDQIKNEETQAIFNNAGTDDSLKRIHFFHGAKHQDLMRYDVEEYIGEWGEFVE